MDKYDYRKPAMKTISAILSNWAVVTFSHQGEVLVDDLDHGRITILFGNIDIDYKGRFPLDRNIRTSLVKYFNKTDFTVTTMNSCYQLNGGGYELVADIDFFRLFMHKGFTPTEIIRCFPHLIVNCTSIEANSTDLH